MLRVWREEERKCNGMTFIGQPCRTHKRCARIAESFQGNNNQQYLASSWLPASSENSVSVHSNCNLKSSLRFPGPQVLQNHGLGIR